MHHYPHQTLAIPFQTKPSQTNDKLSGSELSYATVSLFETSGFISLSVTPLQPTHSDSEHNRNRYKASTKPDSFVSLLPPQ